MLFKLDFQQAYDFVDWDFLRKMGFGHKWMDWMEVGIFTSSMSILVSGSPTSEFLVSKGLRQGDPLSPFLLTIVEEGLVGLVSEAITMGMYKPLHLSEQVSYNMFRFADDMIFMGESSWDNVWALIANLRAFEMLSGLRINTWRSKLYGYGVDDYFLGVTASFMSCRIYKIPFTFLGIYVGGNHKLINFWKTVVNIVKAKLSTWNGNRGNKLDSLWWRDIMLVAGSIDSIGLRQLVTFKPSNGAEILFWTVKWMSPVNLSSQFPELYHGSVDPGVNLAETEEWIGSSWHWNVSRNAIFDNVVK